MFANLKKHLIFEWYAEKILYENALSETMGIFPNEKIYYGYLIDFLKKRNINETKSGHYNIKVPENLFIKVTNRFFDKVDIEFDIEYGEINKQIITKSLYKSSKTIFNEKTGRINTIHMSFNAKINIWNSLDLLIPTICHEFLHAYEDYERILNGKKSLFQTNIENKYYDNTLRSNPTQSVQSLSRV